jgi:predicted TIM-barrel fold metal-dependent hydrolase
VKVTGLERASASGAPFDDAVLFAARLVETAPDRVLWGTDWPHPNLKRMPNDADLVDAVPRYAANAALRQKLLVDNPSRLFGFQK